MRVIRNWRAILTRAWSVWAMAAAVLLTGAEAALPYLPIDISPGAFALLAMVVSALAILFRLLAQKGLTDADED